MDWAELITLDLSLYEKPGGKEELVKQLDHAVRNVGFFYVKNFNITNEEVNRQFSLGREFYALPLEEKLKYHNNDDLTSGNYNGYRPAGLRMYVASYPRDHSVALTVHVYSVGNGVKDNIQVYNIPKFDGHHQRQQPRVLAENINEIEEFSRVSKFLVVVRPCRHSNSAAEMP